ncbi:MAG TPA: PQQ-dependent sugar dehydrogenase [Candidatus Dormibacteraeota bacterium]|nr:PQQ-dependent sugar dehydrogenase [Candidatus Dormibacteraeota bacterium]
MSRLASAALLCVALAACGGTQTSPTPTPRASGSATAGATPTTAAATPSATTDPCDVAGQQPPSGTIAAGFATALAFAPDGRLFWTERSGTVKVWQNGAARDFAHVSTVTIERGGGYSERGLLGLALSPTFSSDHLVFAFYSDANYTQQHVIRWRDCAGTAQDAQVIITLPSGADCCHKGGRLAFGPDGMLYVTLGEEHTSSAAQNTGDVRGKILRYRPDGTVPSDNPFGAGNPVYAYGFRNPFGIAFSSTGQMAVTNNGPSGDSGSPSTGYDELYASVQRGTGYQWADCYGYSHPLATSSCPAGQPGPDWSSERSTVVPTGVTFVDAAGPSAYAGHIVFCTFEGGMRIFTPGSPHGSVATGPSTCNLAVVEGPDHALYWSDAGHIYRSA